MEIPKVRNLAGIDRERLQIAPPEGNPVLILGRDGKIIHMTQAARTLLAYTKETANGISFFALVHQLNIYRVMRDFSTMILYGKEQASWVIPLKAAGGHWQWFNIFVRNQLEENAAILHLTLEEI